jgi:hypothetical protein
MAIEPQFGDPIPVPGSTPPVLELLPMHAVGAEPRLGGKLMQALAAAAPLLGLPHIKRVRKVAAAGQPMLQLLLCPVDWQQVDQPPDAEAGMHNSDQAELHAQPPVQNGSDSCDQQQVGPSSNGDATALPPEVADIVQQHGLQPFVVQVGANDFGQA